MCGNPNKVFTTDNSAQLTSMSRGQHDFNNLCNLSRLTLKKGGFTPMLANHKKGIIPSKRAFLGEIERPVRQLSNQISSFRLETR